MPTQRKFAFIALFACSIALMALYVHRHRQGRTGKLDSVFISVMGFAQDNLFHLGSGIQGLGDHYIFLMNVQKDRERLEKEVAQLRGKLALLEESRLEESRLRALLEFRQVHPEKMIAAKVIAQDISTDFFSIRIDRGTDDGIEVGDGVVSPAGVVGKVFRAVAQYADVLTVLDPASNIDAVVQRSRARGILSGESKKLKCVLRYMDRIDDVQPNDMIVSSGFGGIFPEGLLVGYVRSVESSGILMKVIVDSSVDIYRLEEVFVVKRSPEPQKAS